MTKLNRNIITIKRKGQEAEMEKVEGDKAYLFCLTWELTKDAWAFHPSENTEQRLQRHITKLTRRKR